MWYHYDRRIRIVCLDRFDFSAKIFEGSLSSALRYVSGKDILPQPIELCHSTRSFHGTSKVAK